MEEVEEEQDKMQGLIIFHLMVKRAETLYCFPYVVESGRDTL